MSEYLFILALLIIWFTWLGWAWSRPEKPPRTTIIKITRINLEDVEE